jgi:hypothetical protein
MLLLLLLLLLLLIAATIIMPVIPSASSPTTILQTLPTLTMSDGLCTPWRTFAAAPVPNGMSPAPPLKWMCVQHLARSPQVTD